MARSPRGPAAWLRFSVGEQSCVKVVAAGDGTKTSHDHKTRRNLERFDIVLTVLLAGWVPSILMLLVSYTTLKKDPGIKNFARPPDLCPAHRSLGR